MKIGAIVLGTSPHLEQCLWELDAMKEQVEVRITQGPGDATTLARNLAHSCDLIISCGGDGTFNECVNGLMSTSAHACSIGLHAIGSANDYHRLIGGSGITDIIHAFRSNRTQRIDLMQIKAGTRQAYVTNMSACGIGAEIGKTVNERRGKLPPAVNYYSAIVQWLKRYKAPTLRINMNGKPHETTCFLAGIGKGKFAGNGLGLLPQTSLGDGMLGLTIIEKVGVIDFLKYQSPLKKGEFIQDHRVSYHNINCVDIEVLEGSLAIDLNGDYFTSITKGQQAHFEVIPAALSLVVPTQDLVRSRRPT